MGVGKKNTLTSGGGNRRSFLDTINAFYKQKDNIFHNPRNSNLFLALFTYMVVMVFCVLIWNYSNKCVTFSSMDGIKEFLIIFGDGIVPSVITFAVSIFMQVLICERTITDKIVIAVGVMILIVLYVPARLSESILVMFLSYVIVPFILTVLSLAALPKTMSVLVGNNKRVKHKISA